MKPLNVSLRRTILSSILIGTLGGYAGATPSTTYWTPCVIDIQGYKVGHITYDNYTTLGRKSDTHKSFGQFPNDLGLTVGVLPFQKIQMEVGVDLLEATDDPWYFNAKIGSPENAWFNGSPALQVGIFNVGTKTENDPGLLNRTDQNVGHVITGHTLPMSLGRLHLGGYLANSSNPLYRDIDGSKENVGYMVAYDYGFWINKGPDGDYNRLVLAGDYASGENALGGGGVGVYYYFTKNVSLLSGPVWFNRSDINGDWKWTTQLDINF